MALNLEKQSLLGKGNNSQDQYRLTWRHGLILPALFFLVFGSSLNSIILSEWTQDKIKTDLFLNFSLRFNTTCGVKNKSDSVYPIYQRVQQEATRWSMSYTLAQYIPALFVQLALPSYSDIYGRKFLLVLGGLSFLFKATTVAVTMYFSGSFWYIIVVNIIEGLLGSSFALTSVAFSFVADITSDKNRSLGVILIQSSTIFGVVFGSYFSGYLVEVAKLGFFDTTLMATSLSVVGFILILSLPESLPKTKRAQSKSVLSTIRRIYQFFVSKTFAGKRKPYILLLLAFFFTNLSGMNRSSLEIIYFLGQPFCWGPSKIGTFMLVRRAVKSFVGLATVKPWQKCLADEFIAMIGITSVILSYITEALAQTSFMLYMVPCAGIFSNLAVSMIQSIMSSMTSQDKQGAMFASIGTIELLGLILAAITESEVYSYTMSFMNGFVFLVMAFFAALAMVMLLAYTCTKPSERIAEFSVQVNK